MAKFTNKKEQVFDLQLTSYAKYLMSIGKFKPAYYAFYDDNVLEKLLTNPPASDVIYGDSLILYKDGYTRLQKGRPIDTIWQRMPFVHQSSIVKREHLVRHPFDLSYPLCADFGFFYKLYQNGNTFEYRAATLSKFRAGGMSDIKRVATAKEVWRSVKKYRNDWRVAFYFRKRILAARLNTLISPRLKSKLIRWKYGFKSLRK